MPARKKGKTIHKTKAYQPSPGTEPLTAEAAQYLTASIPVTMQK